VAFDPFGVKNEPPRETGTADTVPLRPAHGGSRTLWGGLLAVIGLVLLLCAGGLYARIRHLSQPPLVVARTPAKPAAAAPEAKTPAKEESPQETKPAAPETKKEPAKTSKTPAAKEAAKPAPPAPKAAAPAAEPANGASARPAGGVSKPVDFSYADAGAKEVYLLGPFLVRTNGRKPMFKDSSGEWRLTVYLKSGSPYAYRFEAIDAHGKRHLTKKQTVEVP
jgi:hypothetical protein